eukprot:2209083-Rhodomonas_salina.1
MYTPNVHSAAMGLCDSRRCRRPDAPHRTPRQGTAFTHKRTKLLCTRRMHTYYAHQVAMHTRPVHTYSSVMHTVCAASRAAGRPDAPHRAPRLGIGRVHTPYAHALGSYAHTPCAHALCSYVHAPCTRRYAAMHTHYAHGLCCSGPVRLETLKMRRLEQYTHYAAMHLPYAHSQLCKYAHARADLQYQVYRARWLISL